MTIIVGGYIIGFPLGGMTWHHLNYLLGLHDMGHDVWFLEDSGSFSLPYNPTNWTSAPDPTYGIDYLKRTFKEYGLPEQFCYYSEFLDRHYGLSKEQLDDLLGRADLLLCVSGVTPLRDNRPRARRCVVIDTDPVFTQLRMQADADFLRYYEQFDAVATFGRLIGTAHSPLPVHGFDWVPTNQPIALRHWRPAATQSRAFTTIGKWEHSTDRHVEFAGRRYHSSKGMEWLKVIDLPAQAPMWEMTIGMTGLKGDMRDRFVHAGWRMADAEQASISCRAFQDFLSASAGEFTVAKEIYAGLPSGWFSDRSSAYLALGKPVVTQSSGFEHWLPTGEGLFSFKTPDEAADALRTIDADYHRHSRAARQIAETYFDATRVLDELLDHVM